MMSDAARSLSTISTKLHLLDLLVMFVGTVAFEFLAKASSDFRREMEEMMAEKEKKERKKKRRGKWDEPEEGDMRVLSML